MYANAILKALHTSCNQVWRMGDSLAVTEAMYANAILEALHTLYDQVQCTGDSLLVTEAMYMNVILEALHTSCDQARHMGDSHTIIIHIWNFQVVPLAQACPNNVYLQCVNFTIFFLHFSQCTQYGRGEHTVGLDLIAEFNVCTPHFSSQLCI